MKRWVLMIVGVVLVLLGLVWTGQGLDLFHQTGGMNGHKIFAVIGIVVAVVGLVLVVAGARSRRPAAQP
jgi:hypothetical protein